MVDESKLFDIDYLKENKKRLYYFGLGFIQLVLNDSQRIHFYNRKLPQTNDEVHNHRYNFKSKILKGMFHQEFFNLYEGDSHILMNESCNKDNKIESIKYPVELVRTSFDSYGAGKEYYIPFNQFHRVDYEGNTITLLTRETPIVDFAQVVYEKDKDITCPFSTQISEEELWELIKDTIDNE